MRIVRKGPFVPRSVQYQTLKVCFDQSCERLCMYESLRAWLTVDRSRFYYIRDDILVSRKILHSLWSWISYVRNSV